MISLEHQVTSLKLSRRLAHLKVKQDSLFYWWHDIDGWVVLYNPATIYREGGYSAFTSAEHGIALPRNIHSYRDTDLKTDFWVCEQRFKNREFADTEANARAKMRIYLIEHKLVEVKGMKRTKTQKERDEILYKKLWKYSPSLAESLRKAKREIAKNARPNI